MPVTPSPLDGQSPIGLPELVAAATGALRVLDLGCGSGRLTVALARAGASVTGADSSRATLEQARARASEAEVELELIEADFNDPLPFPEASFEAVTSRLALMVASDPVATLREASRVLTVGGRIATAIWATIAQNPWFGVPREAIAAALGAPRADFARAFGRYGGPDELATLHRAAGLCDVEARLVEAPVRVVDAATQWAAVARENGHFRRVDASLTEEERGALARELEQRLERYRDGAELVLARTVVVVTARR